MAEIVLKEIGLAYAEPTEIQLIEDFKMVLLMQLKYLIVSQKIAHLLSLSPFCLKPLI